MFENLSDRLQKVFKDLRGYGKLTPENIQDGLREVRLALLEADVNFKVVKDFIATIEERAVGREVLESLTPGQQVWRRKSGRACSVCAHWTNRPATSELERIACRRSGWRHRRCAALSVVCANWRTSPVSLGDTCY